MTKTGDKIKLEVKFSFQRQLVATFNGLPYHAYPMIYCLVFLKWVEDHLKSTL